MERTTREHHCPICGSTPAEASSAAAMQCSGLFHRGEPGRIGDSQSGVLTPVVAKTVDAAVVLCRCLPCCCKPGEGHNDPRWIAYEKALDELEAALEGGP